MEANYVNFTSNRSSTITIAHQDRSSLRLVPREQDEILQIIQSDELLRTLQTLELEHNLPPATAHRFKALYDEASSVCEQEEERYAATWDDYHEALDDDQNLATIARAYGESQGMPLYRRIAATGTFIF